MAARLCRSHKGLERKVAARTRELELANQARSRFLRAASHDLRQPMHALGLFVAQSSANESGSLRLGKSRIKPESRCRHYRSSSMQSSISQGWIQA
jgi:signal transduction histidine kinase